MKLQGNYYDHPTLGLVRVPATVALNRYEYEYHPDLGFIKKIKKGIKKIGKPFEKAIKKVVPKEIRKLVPKELKGGIEKPLALAAGGYGLYTLGAGSISAGAATAAKSVASGAGKILAGAGTVAKTAAPVVGSLLVSGGKAAGNFATAALEQAPNLIAAKNAMEQQQAQVRIHEIESNAQLQAMQQQNAHERAMLEIQMATAGSSIPSQGIVYPGAAGVYATPQMFPSMATAGAGGMDPNMMLLAGAGVLAAILLTSKKR